ncbi:MAG: hypothetical protein KDI30_07055, partial [Pseudomonadales bacterium]|nr:hypothetical protein [Pseudomonadales bacterium]
MAKHSVIGGINYWTETMIIIDEFKKHYGDRLLEIEYESMVAKPKPYIEKILEFIGEDSSIMNYSSVDTHKEKNKYKQLLNSKEIALVQDLTQPFYENYGYKPVK